MRIPGTLNAALVAVVGGACCGALWVASHGPLWAALTAMVAFSFLNNTMFALLHESVHGIAHDDRRVNELLGRLAAPFFPTSLSLQRVFHLAHHARNRTVDEQFDYIRPFDRPWLKRAQWYAILTGLYWVFVPLGGVAYLVAPGVFLGRGRSLALPLSRGPVLRFFLLGAGLAAARIIAIHLGAPLGAVLGAGCLAELPASARAAAGKPVSAA